MDPNPPADSGQPPYPGAYGQGPYGQGPYGQGPYGQGPRGPDPSAVADGVARRTSGLTPVLTAGGAAVGLVLFLVVFGASAVTPKSSTSSKSGAPPALFFGFIVVALGVQLVTQLWGWWARTYTVLPTELVVDEGILTRHHRVLPYTRVQQIDLHRPFVAQLFGLAEVRVDTAGVAGATSVKLRFLEQSRAEALRAYVLLRREELRHEPAATAGPGPGPGSGPGSGGAVPLAGAPPYVAATAAPVRELLRLGPGRLLLAAFTHHFVLLALPVLLVVGLWGYAFAKATDPNGVVAGAALGFVAVVVFGLFVFASAMNAVIGQYGWTLTAEGDDLHLRFGLFEVRNLTVPRARIQQVTVVDNPVRRTLGVVSLTLHTAALVTGAEGMQGGNQSVTRFEVPLLDRSGLDHFLVDLLGDHEWVLPELTPRPRAARRRAMTRRTLVCAVVLGVPAVLLRPNGLALLPLAALGLLWGAEAHRRAGHGVSAGLVALSKGVLHHRIDLVPLDRIQGCRTDANPFQRASKVTTFVLDVAGSTSAPDLHDVDAATARSLRTDLPRRGVALAHARRTVRGPRAVP